MISEHDILRPFQDDEVPQVGMIGWCSRFLQDKSLEACCS